MEQISVNPKPFATNKSFAAVVAKQPVRDVPLATPATVSFNNVVNNSLRNQGIAFDSLEENVSIEVYLDALCKNVSTNAITHISKSSRMINVYFTSATWADQMIRDGLDVKDFHLDVRPIATTPIKVIVSNVPPEIGHQFIRNEMSKFGRVVGPIKTLSAATSRPEYSHIRSFRRMVLMEFTNDEAMDRLPRQMNFTLDGKPYSFYTSLDVKCFRCGKMGHFRKSCPEVETVSFANPKVATPDISESTATVPSIVNQDLPATVPSTVVNQDQPARESSVAGIQSSENEASAVSSQPAPILSDTLVIESKMVSSPKIQKRKKKKLKRSGSSPDSFTSTAKVSVQAAVPDSFSQVEDESMSSVASSDCEDMEADIELIEPGLLDNFTSDMPLTVPVLVKFLNDVKGSPHRLRVARRYTDDIGGLVNQVKQLGYYLKKCPIKSKVLSQPRVVRVYTGLNEEFNFNA